MLEFDTKTAVEKIAEHLPDEKITASTVSGFLKKHPNLAPPKVLGRFYLWTDESVVALVKAWKQIKAGICLHCGKPADGSLRVTRSPTLTGTAHLVKMPTGDDGGAV